MDRRITFITVILIFVTLIGVSFKNKQNEPWRVDQLMSPSDLADEINHPTDQTPLIISVGPAGLIKGSIEAGPANETDNQKKLRKILSEQDKEKPIVIYCGCCPFKDCPNIRPAFTLLNSMHFRNHKLLNIAQNLSVDWIDRGYPVNESK